MKFICKGEIFPKQDKARERELILGHPLKNNTGLKEWKPLSQRFIYIFYIYLYIYLFSWGFSFALMELWKGFFFSVDTKTPKPQFLFCSFPKRSNFVDLKRRFFCCKNATLTHKKKLLFPTSTCNSDGNLANKLLSLIRKKCSCRKPEAAAAVKVLLRQKQKAAASW